MSDAALFAVGGLVTVMVVVGLVALWYAAVLDGRTEELHKEGIPPGREREDWS